MSEERRLILQMLSAGRVTVEQADQLLEALGDTAPSALHESTTGTKRQRRGEEADDFFARLTPKQLIKLRDHGVSAVFVQQMRAAGLRDLGVDDLIALYNHGVTPHFVRDLGEAGFTDLTPADLVTLLNHGVGVTFLREMREMGFAEAPLAQFVALYNHGVDAAFVREMRALGFAHLAPEELIHLRNHGVESDFVRKVQNHAPTRRGEWEESGR